MPSLDLYKKTLVRTPTNRDVRKAQADMIIENTWWTDIESQEAYIYNHEHDDEPTKLADLNSTESTTKQELDIKCVQHTSQSYSGDRITYHLQMRPSQECNLDYYDAEGYGSFFPCGLYVDIKDNKGKYNRWLVVHYADYFDSQFSTFEILPCNYVFRWMYNGEKHITPGVLRTINSYNTGITGGTLLERADNQQKFIIPLNRETEKLYYNQRLIIDANVLTEPLAWRVAKIDRLSPAGIMVLALEQDEFNSCSDYIEIDEDTGQVIGMWADYYDYALQDDSVSDVELSYSGLRPEIKIGGSAKTITVLNTDDETGTWAYLIDGEDASDVLSISEDTYETTIQFIGDYTYLNSVLEIQYLIDDTLVANLKLDIKSL